VKILMTGFEPFLGERINPSEELLKFFSQESRGGNIDTLLLPVSYRRSVELLSQKIEEKAALSPYDFLLLCGQAGGRRHVCLERAALNWIDADKADEDGALYLETPIRAGGPSAYLSSLPLRRWLTSLRAKGFSQVEISNSAGAFVCNHLYYRMFEHFAALSDFSPAPKVPPLLFLHVPYMTEQLMGKPPETFGMSLKCLQQIVSALLDEIEAGQF
jgi:pyroglutamyl-peptidase